MAITLNNTDAKLIADTCRAEGLLRNETAYVLATAYHETGAFKYMKEIWGPTKAQKGYEGRTDLGNIVAGDGKKFLGRGYVMITGRRNYTDWGKRLGLDLIGNPDQVSDRNVAVKILVQGMKLGTFTGKKLAHYIDLNKSNFVDARRIINGTDKAAMIAEYAKQYDKLLLASGYGVTVTPSGAEQESKVSESSGPTETGAIALLKVILELITKFLGGKNG